MLNYRDIAKIFEEIEIRLISSMKRNLGRHKQEENQYGFDWTAWQAEKFRNIDKFRQENSRIMSSYTNVIDNATHQIMLDEFAQGMNGINTALSENIPDTPAEITGEPDFFGIDKTKVNKLIDDVVNLEKHAENAVLRTMDDIYRQTVNKAQLAMSTGSMTLQQAIDMSVRDFLNKGINCIVYRDGRRVNIADYVRMALRTTATRAGLYGMSAKIRQLGYDTVLVSSYGMCSETCLPWQGRPYIDDVFSVWNGEIQERSNGELWGKSHYCGKWFPLLSTALHGGLFHPNCRHTITMWRDGDPVPKPQDNSEIQRRYKLEQQQRHLENKVRKAKRLVAGQSDPTNIRKAKKLLRDAQKELREFIGDTNLNEGEIVLRRDYGKEKIYTVSVNPTLTQSDFTEQNYQKSHNSKKAVDNSESYDIIGSKHEFVPAENVAKAEEYAKDVLGIKNVSYKGVDTKTANEWNRGLADAFSRFPELKKNFGFVGTCQERNKFIEEIYRKAYTEAYINQNPDVSIDILKPYIDKKVKEHMESYIVSPSTYAKSFASEAPLLMQANGVTVNSNYGSNSEKFIESLVKNVEYKGHPIGCDTIRSVIDHEIGHQLDQMLDISNISEIRHLFDSRTTEQLTNDLSIYSWNNKNPNKYSEMIAEAWAEYCNNPQPRKIAQTVGETIEKLYSIKYKD